MRDYLIFFVAFKYTLFVSTSQANSQCTRETHEYIRIAYVNTYQKKIVFKCTHHLKLNVNYLLWTATILKKKYAFLLIINFIRRLFINHIINWSILLRKVLSRLRHNAHYFIDKNKLVAFCYFVILRILLFSRWETVTTDEYRKRQASIREANKFIWIFISFFSKSTQKKLKLKPRRKNIK